MDRPIQKKIMLAPKGSGSAVSGQGMPSGTVAVRDVLEALYDTVLVTDPEGFIVESNGRAERHLGYGREDLLGRPVCQIIEGVSPEVVANIWKNLDRGKFTVLEAYCSRKDRTGFLAEMAVGQLGYNGTSRMMFTLRNIEPRREVQELLRAEHNALENSASGIAITDASARIVQANTAFLKLWEFASLKEATGLDVRDLWQGTPVPIDLIRRPMSGRSWIGEVAARTRKGRAFFVQVSAAPNRDSNDRISGVVLSFLDVTARRKAETALRREAEAQMARARQSNDFSGLLTALTIPDLIQLIDSTRKTGKLVILGETDRTVGTVEFLEGQVQAAQCGVRTGEPAIFALLQAGGQGFRFDSGKPAEKDPSIERSTMGLLLEAVHLADEAALKPEGTASPAGAGGGAASGSDGR
jgi:PAS domain S-box-containing protein